jgi:hypothetical protein
LTNVYKYGIIKATNRKKEGKKMIKFLKCVFTPIDMIISKVTNGKMKNVIWSALTRHECKTRGMRVRAVLHSDPDEVVTGSFFCGWFLTDDNRLFEIAPVKFLKENFQEKLDK